MKHAHKNCVLPGLFADKLQSVNNSRSIHNLALIGFMGAGKSSVGRLVAERLQFGFFDTDALIEERTGQSIAKIFAEQGERAFRLYEEQTVAELASAKGVVISTGGGLVTNPANLASLKTHALVICLWVTPEVIWERVREHTHRPLLQTPDPLARIRDLLAQREPLYRQADVLIHASSRPLSEVAEQVLQQFEVARAVGK